MAAALLETGLLLLRPVDIPGEAAGDGLVALLKMRRTLAKETKMLDSLELIANGLS